MAAGLSWAPAITGDLSFPHNRDVTTDYATAAAETWTDSVGGGAQTFTGKVLAADRLDVDHALKMQGGPWFIFCATLDFGAGGDMNGDGPDGILATLPNRDYAIGATYNGSEQAEGGSGGVMLFIVAAAVTGSNRTISANGGDATRNTTNAAGLVSYGGEGALSWANNAAGNTGGAELWYGATLRELPASMHELLGDGGTPGQTAAADGVGGRGGGSGAGSAANSAGGGGSGIGGGGRAAGAIAGAVARQEANPLQLLELAQRGCKGGGGGAASVHTTGTSNAAGGGGAGSACVWAQTLTATPIISVSGGAAANGGAGAAGVSYLIDVP